MAAERTTQVSIRLSPADLERADKLLEIYPAEFRAVLTRAQLLAAACVRGITAFEETAGIREPAPPSKPFSDEERAAVAAMTQHLAKSAKTKPTKKRSTKK